MLYFNYSSTLPIVVLIIIHCKVVKIIIDHIIYLKSMILVDIIKKNILTHIKDFYWLGFAHQKSHEVIVGVKWIHALVYCCVFLHEVLCEVILNLLDFCTVALQLHSWF